MSVQLAVSDFAADRELAQFCSRLEGEGAVASFLGLTRHRTREGEPILGLFLEAHPRLTKPSMEAIGEAALARFDISSLRIVHRCGLVPPGEPIVFVAAASAHRRAALEAVDYMMDRLKSDALFWKREDSEKGSSWIEPVEADRKALQRWSRNCPE